METHVNINVTKSNMAKTLDGNIYDARIATGG
jgi:hypothetical protein